MMKADVVIVSAGKGQRMMEGRKKQFLSLAGKPILAHTLDQFESCPLIHSILLVVGQEDLDFCLKEIVEKYQYRKISKILPGGKQRQDSVKNGIDALPGDVDIVAIHDGVRPFVTQEMIEESIRSAERFGAVALAMPVRETIKIAHPDGTVFKTLDRESLYQIQTPQTFQANVIKEAFQKAAEDGFIGTDDASLVERLGIKFFSSPVPIPTLKLQPQRI